MSTSETITVITTEVMNPSKRAAGFYPRRCEYGKCGLPAWYIQRGNRRDGRGTFRVVCKGHSLTTRWTIK